MKLASLAVLTVLACSLMGCAEVSALVSTATTAAAANQKVANTNILNADKVKAQTAADSFCTMTVETLFSNPQWVKSVEALCWSGAPTTATAAAEASIPPAKPVAPATQ